MENCPKREIGIVNAWRIRMRLLVSVLPLLVGPYLLVAQSKPPAQMSGIGGHHHIISTKSSEAQGFFDQGLTLVFAFNHEEAARAFRRAAELDPQSAMPFWGIALALGPCINNVDPPHEKAAYEAVRKAMSLAQDVTESERAYIEALARFSGAT
jgi:tetratricopeptide (TPR) repeat protein